MYIRVPLSALVLRKMEGEAGINQRHARQGAFRGNTSDAMWMKCFGQTGRREWMPNESPVELDYICQQWGDCPKNLHK